MKPFQRIDPPAALPRLHQKAIKNILIYLESRQWGDGLELMKKIIQEADINQIFLAKLKTHIEDYQTTEFRALCEQFGSYTKPEHLNAVNSIDTGFMHAYNPSGLDFPCVYGNLVDALRNSIEMTYCGEDYLIHVYHRLDEALNVTNKITGEVFDIPLKTLQRDIENIELFGLKPVAYQYFKD